MNSLHFSFDYSPLLIPLCLALGVVYAFLLYSPKPIWSRLVNRLLFLLRALVVAFIAFLLIGPALQLTVSDQEKPSLVVLIDNSSSVREVIDSTTWNTIYERLQVTLKQLTQQGFDTPIKTLDGVPNETIHFAQASSDLNGATRQIVEEYEGKNLAGLIVVSDGIYNSGMSPLYSTPKVPVYTLGIGDTAKYADISIKSVVYNKIVQQGNVFPLCVEILVRGMDNSAVTVTVYHNKQPVAKKTKKTESARLLEYCFEVEALEKGLQKFDIEVAPLPIERNVKNNRSSAYIEVVGGKKKVLMVSPAPHPDNKAIRAVVAQNTDYELSLYIPRVQQAALKWSGKEKPDLVVLRYATGEKKITSLLDSIKKHNIPLFIMLGEGGSSFRWQDFDVPVSFEQSTRRRDVRPRLNPKYQNFILPGKLRAVIARYPPVSTFVKKTHYPPNAEILLYQNTDKTSQPEPPLLLTLPHGNHSTAILLGENIWRWRMSEFAEYGSTESFDILFSKLIRYLSTKESKQRFRSFPLQNEFTMAESVSFESQVYNNIFEPVYGYPIVLRVTDEQGNDQSYRYTTTPHQSRYTFGPLEEGVYRYRASAVVEGKEEIVKGQFRVTAQYVESQNLTADFTLLREWARRTGGAFYTVDKSSRLVSDFEDKEATPLSHSTTSLHSLINLKGLFVLLLLLIGGEWVLRKFMGSY